MPLSETFSKHFSIDVKKVINNLLTFSNKTKAGPLNNDNCPAFRNSEEMIYFRISH